MLVALAGPPVAHGASPSSGRATAQQRSHEIAQLIGSAACNDDSDCRVIGIGARACGGPQRYAAWSVLQTDPAVLQRFVDFDAQERKKELEAEGIQSNCIALPAPGVRCRRAADGGRGHCVLQEDRTGSAGVR